MTRTKVGLLIALTLIATGASAASPNVTSLKQIESELIQKVHTYNGTIHHTACAGGHNWRLRQNPATGGWYWAGPLVPCAIGPWKRQQLK